AVGARPLFSDKAVENRVLAVFGDFEGDSKLTVAANAGGTIQVASGVHGKASLRDRTISPAREGVQDGKLTIVSQLEYCAATVAWKVRIRARQVPAGVGHAVQVSLRILH